MKRLWIMALAGLLLLMAGCQIVEELIDPTETAAKAQTGEREVLVFISADLSDAEARAIGTQFNRIPGVIRAEFVSREQVLDDFLEHYEDKSAFEGVDATGLRHRYIITVTRSEWPAVCQQLEEIDGIDEVKMPVT